MAAPTVQAFLTFVRNVAGIAAAYLPDDAPIITYAYDAALNVVNDDLGSAPAQQGAWSPYEQAIYNLGTHDLIEFAPDLSYAITAASWAAGVVSLTTAVNAIVVGDRIAVAGISPNGYNGVFRVLSVIDNQHLQYIIGTEQGGRPTNPGPATSVAGATVSGTFFRDARAGLKMSAFAPGMVTSANDLSTGAGLLNPEFMRHLTLENLQLTKTSYGRAYLGIAQKYGPTIWGLT